MYNPDQKQRYIEYKKQETIISESSLVGLFNMTESFEKEFNKDLCNFTTNEIKVMYKLWNLDSLDVITNRNSAYKSYSSWAQSERLIIDNQNHFDEFDINILNSLLNKNALKQKIVDRATILSWCKRLLNPRDAYILLCIFEFGKGDYFSDIVNSKIGDINRENNTMVLQSGRSVSISDELIDYADKSRSAIEYISARCSKLYDDGTIIKRHSTAKSTTDSFYLNRAAYAALKRGLGSINVKISSTNIMYSGIINMINQRSYELNISTKEYLSRYKEEIKKQYDVIIKPAMMLKKYGDYL